MFDNERRRIQMANNGSGREIITRGNDKRYVRRDKRGRFMKVVDVGASLGRDVRQHAETKVGKGQGDRGDAA
jgi:hypothetical protein